MHTLMLQVQTRLLILSKMFFTWTRRKNNCYKHSTGKIFLSGMSLRRTSKDLNSCPLPLPSPLRQNLDKNQNLDEQINSFHIQIKAF